MLYEVTERKYASKAYMHGKTPSKQGKNEQNNKNKHRKRKYRQRKKTKKINKS